MNTFKERLYPDHGQYLAVASVFCACRTDYQDVLVFENPTFGKVLVLDGIVQLTERDSHVYHEMIAHVPMIAHGDARDVLIIGGGDGGTLREVIKHPIDSVTLVELDPKVIEISQQYLPGISGGAFADPRLSVVLGDGARYIAEAGRRFDVIIVDSTDPIGPAQALFTDPFYAACRMALRETGVISLQSGCPFYQTAHVTRALSRLRDRFGAAGAYLAPVPTYANGLLALMIAGLEDHLIPALEVLRSRVEMIGLDTEYYSPVVHHAAFAMPPRFARNYDDDQSEERFARPLSDWIGRPIRRRTLASRTSR